MMVERMTASQFRRQKGGKGPSRAPSAKRKNKYGNDKIIVQGIKFDSKREAQRFQHLRLMERAGLISDLKLQVPIPLIGQYGPLKGASGRALTYRADFTYIDTSTGKLIVNDAKGFETTAYKLKKAILAAQGIEIMES